mmetsp:Transcript_22766/g.43758  ORF Transcript_22766/g.43758 Transcript_22766/m.43758 type:complete len:248 (+) Transcript_22766:1895-2638(+)
MPAFAKGASLMVVPVVFPLLTRFLPFTFAFVVFFVLVVAFLAPSLRISSFTSFVVSFELCFLLPPFRAFDIQASTPLPSFGLEAGTELFLPLAGLLAGSLSISSRSCRSLSSSCLSSSSNFFSNSLSDIPLVSKSAVSRSGVSSSFSKLSKPFSSLSKASISRSPFGSLGALFEIGSLPRCISEASRLDSAYCAPQVDSWLLEQALPCATEARSKPMQTVIRNMLKGSRFSERSIPNWGAGQLIENG